MWRALFFVASLRVVACTFVTTPVEMKLEDWHDLMGDASTANLQRKIQPGMPRVLAEVFGAVEGERLAVGGLVSRYQIQDFIVDSQPQKTIIARNNNVVVNNTNTPGFTPGVAKVDTLANFTAITHTRLESKMELSTDAQVSMCKDLPLVGCQKWLDRTVRVFLTFAGTIPIRAALSLAEPRLQLFDGKKHVVFNFNVSLTTEGVKWEAVAVTTDIATCEIRIGGVPARVCSKVEGIFRRRSLEHRPDLAITEVATEHVVLGFMDHIRTAVGRTVTIPLNVTSPSLLVE